MQKLLRRFSTINLVLKVNSNIYKPIEEMGTAAGRPPDFQWNACDEVIYIRLLIGTR